MGTQDHLVEVPVQCGAGRMRIAGYSLPIPVFSINFGSSAPSRTAQFFKYKKMALAITEINKFQHAYAIHCDRLFYVADDGTVRHVENSEDAPEAAVYEFFVTHNISRAAHKLFTDARVASGGQWVLLVRTETILFLLMDARGNILQQVVRTLDDISGINWVDPS